MKSVLWAGCNFADEFFVIKNGIFKNFRKAGGINNCFIPDAKNQYLTMGGGVAKFLLSEQLSASTIDFVIGYDCSLDKFEADWLHIPYIDALPNLDLLKLDKEKYKVISCDFCHPKQEITSIGRIVENLQYCDVIFDNYNCPGPRYQEHLEDEQIWVLHSPIGSTVSNNGNLYRYDILKKDYIFTIGAGDHFAAAFIEARLQDYDLRQSQELAHSKVATWLEEINEQL